MATRGFLIRFIDIGLIVLFGFLMISDIDASSRVELGGATEEVDEPVEEEEDRAFIVVEIVADGSFVVGEGPSPGAGTEEALAGGDSTTAASSTVRVVSVVDLENAVDSLRRRHRAAGLETVVLIEPHPASAVQRTVDAMDVADRLGIAKSLRMDIEVVDRTPVGGEGS